MLTTFTPVAHAADLPASPIITKAPVDPVPKWSPWVEFGGYYGSGKASRGEAALWVPFWQNDQALLFADIRGKLFEDDVREGNFALGYRQMLSSGWNLGLWGGYDLRRSQAGNLFPQVSGGLELLGDRFDVRFNGYLPLADEKTLSSTTATSSVGTVALVGATAIAMTTTTTVTTTTSKELALWGVDGEIGMRLFGSAPAAPGPKYELRAYLGGFYFDHADLPGEVAGPKARLELRIDDLTPALAGSRLTFEGEFSYDDVRKDKWEVGARLRIPFGVATRVASLTPQERRMTEALERDTDIVTQSRTTSTSTAATIQENVLDNDTGVALNQVVNVDATSNPNAINTAAANSLIVVDGAAGNLVGTRGLPGNTTLMGGGATIAVRGATSGTVATFTASGARPTLSVVGNDPNLNLNGSNVHVAGLDIAGSGAGNIDNGGIVSENRTNVVIGNVAIDNTGADGIRIAGTNAATWTIADTTVSNAGDHGIFIVGSKTVAITGTTIRDVTVAGIRLFFTNNTVTLNNSTFAGNFGTNGIHFDAGATSNSLNGAGNTAAGATFGGSLCKDNGANWAGTVTIDGTAITNANCTN